MLFWLPIRIGRYTLYIHFMRYGTRTHTVLRGPGPLKARLMRIRWLPILRPEIMLEMHQKTSLGELNFPLPFRYLCIEIYRNEPPPAPLDFLP